MTSDPDLFEEHQRAVREHSSRGKSVRDGSDEHSLWAAGPKRGHNSAACRLLAGLAALRMIDLKPIFADVADRFRELLEVDRFDDVTVGAHLVGAHDVTLLGR